MNVKPLISPSVAAEINAARDQMIESLRASMVKLADDVRPAMDEIAKQATYALASLREVRLPTFEGLSPSGEEEVRTPRELLDAYADEYLDPEGECVHDHDDYRHRAAPRAFAALRAVMDLHCRVPGLAGSGTAFCLTCWVPDKERMVPESWPCPTVRAITTALEET